jgi:hypothetical protein
VVRCPVGESRPPAPTARVTTTSADAARLVPLHAVHVCPPFRTGGCLGHFSARVPLIVVGILSGLIGAFHGGRAGSMSRRSNRAGDRPAGAVVGEPAPPVGATGRETRRDAAPTARAHRRSARTSRRQSKSQAARQRGRRLVNSDAPAAQPRASTHSSASGPPVPTASATPAPVRRQHTTSRTSGGPEFF